MTCAPISVSDEDKIQFQRELDDSLLMAYIEWCNFPWYRRAWRRVFSTGLVFAGTSLPEGTAYCEYTDRIVVAPLAREMADKEQA